MIWGGDGHSLWVNGRALDVAGMDRSTPDPAGGRIERDATGAPSGTLREAAATAMELAAPAWSMEKRLRALGRSLERMGRLGITAFLDAAVDDDDMLETYREASRRGMLTAHAGVSLAVPRESEALDVEALVESFVAMRASDTFPDLSVQAAKIFVDGVIEAGTAAMIEPYTGTQSRGDLLRPAEVLEPLVAALREKGFQLHFHAIGDGAIRVVLDALETTPAGVDPPGPPLIAHAQLVDPADVSRFATVGAVPVFSAVWAYEDGYIRDLTVPRLGPERSQWIYPIRTVERAGATIAFGSDWPVTTMDPLQAIEVAVTRMDPDAPADSAGPFLADERLDVATAIEAATLGSARAVGRGEVSGSITSGKRADIIVLSDNILEIEAREIGDARVLLTVFGGRIVYRHEDFASADPGADDNRQVDRHEDPAR
jgi:predicted amidohydrolase YtcJ